MCEKSNFPDADAIVHQGARRNPALTRCGRYPAGQPARPDGGIWIRTQHRVGRRSRENMVWPQVSLAQMAAILRDNYTVKVSSTPLARKSAGPNSPRLLDKYQPKYYLTQVTAPTLENDMYGTFLAKNRGAKTIAFGTHVTPIPVETMKAYPTLDFVLYGEPDLTIRDLLDHLEGKIDQRPPQIQVMFDKEMGYKPSIVDGQVEMSGIRGIAWRRGDEIVKNIPRPFVADLDDLPIPLHELLPLQSYQMPMMKGPFTFIVTSRGCTAGCTYCIKHVSYQYSVRVRSPEKIVEELWVLKKLGIHNIHMYADLFTVSRDQVMDMCKLIIEQGLKIKWTCNSRVDYVDEEMLSLMAKAGCWLISWGIESGNEQILKHARKGAYPDRASHSLPWPTKPGSTTGAISSSVCPARPKKPSARRSTLPRSCPWILPCSTSPRPTRARPSSLRWSKKAGSAKAPAGSRWIWIKRPCWIILSLPAERLMYWQRRAFREWAFRPRPAFTYLKMLLSDSSTFKIALDVGLQTLKWQVRGNEG